MDQYLGKLTHCESKTIVILEIKDLIFMLHSIKGAVIKNVTDRGGKDFVGVRNHFLKICWGVKKFL